MGTVARGELVRLGGGLDQEGAEERGVVVRGAEVRGAEVDGARLGAEVRG